MILHCVFCHLRDDVSDTELSGILTELASFSASLDGVLSFEFGPNRDFENKSADFRYGFVIRFTDADALATYADHPTHKALGSRLRDLCEGGAEGIVVFDLETGG